MVGAKARLVIWPASQADCIQEPSRLRTNREIGHVIANGGGWYRKYILDEDQAQFLQLGNCKHLKVCSGALKQKCLFVGTGERDAISTTRDVIDSSIVLTNQSAMDRNQAGAQCEPRERGREGGGTDCVAAPSCLTCWHRQNESKAIGADGKREGWASACVQIFVQRHRAMDRVARKLGQTAARRGASRTM